MNPYDFNLCRGLAAAGVDTALFTSDETPTPEGDAFHFRPVYREVFAQVPSWRRGLRYLRGTLAALRDSLLEGRRVCHFHCFRIGPPELVNILLSRILLRKVVITAHDVECFVAGFDTPGLPRRAYGLAHAVIAHNQVSRMELERIMGVRPERIRVIPAGNHLDSFPELPDRAKARARLGLPETAPVLLFFGQIKQVKGLDVLLEALPAILERHPETRLVIAGKTLRLDFSIYEEQMDRLGIRDRCLTHIRYIPDGELPDYYAACDLVTLPYRKIYQSDVILMAMSCGKPVVTSDIPGMLELIEDQRTGFLFRSGDAADLARSINAALDDSGHRERVAAAGTELMKEKYSWSKIGKMTADLYRSL